MPRRTQLIGFIVLIQLILFFVHFFLYKTWTFSPVGQGVSGASGPHLVITLLSMSFIAASLLAFRYTNAAVRALYKVSAVWLGLVSFLFLGAVGTWVIFGIGSLMKLHLSFQRVLEVLSGIGLVL